MEQHELIELHNKAIERLKRELNTMSEENFDYYTELDWARISFHLRQILQFTEGLAYDPDKKLN